jgi:hypothetical protein
MDGEGNLRVIVTCGGEPMVFDVPASHGCTVEDVRRAMFAFAVSLRLRGRGRLRGLFERVKKAASPVKEAHG